MKKELQYFTWISCFLYALASIGVFCITSRIIHLVLVWNLFLAVLPLSFAFAWKNKLEQKKKLHSFLWGILWFFFFPNAPYMVTDFIHIGGIEFYTRIHEYMPAIYSPHITDWIILLHITIGVILGITFGYLSLYTIHTKLWKIKKSYAIIFLLCISILSGYAIYIGRFLRFNSWDILNPIQLTSTLIQNFSWFAIQFSCLFAAFILAAYGVFHFIFRYK